MTPENLGKLEEFDKLKTKVLKYVLYKKRTEQEVRQKFNDFSGKLLDVVINYLKEENYINDSSYIEKSINEIKKLKNFSIKEIKYKLLSKGLSKDIIQDYIDNNKEDLIEYEINSAKSIILKKSNVMEYNDILNFLRKKGYTEGTIKQVGEDNE